MQTTSHLLMIRPVAFGFNAETAVNNAFQVNTTAADTNEKAVQEFDRFVQLLRDNGVDITVVEDTPEPHTPDSIFPNNWVSFHSEGNLLLYPMYARNRRLERKHHVIEAVKEKFAVSQVIDLSNYESEDLYLEGTGSMVLDRVNRISYACISPRTDVKVLERFCKSQGYTAVVFTANDGRGLPIYHTNVMMCIADNYTVICLDSISDLTERSKVADSFRHTGKEIIPISLDQMDHFAGNMLQVENLAGDKLLVMSTQAWNALTDVQQARLQSCNRVLHASLDTIESNGGGSARCMMAEIHLPLK